MSSSMMSIARIWFLAGGCYFAKRYIQFPNLLSSRAIGPKSSRSLNWAVANSLSANLQGAIYRALTEDQKLRTIIGDAVFDEEPIDSELPQLYIRIGEDACKDRSSATHSATEIRFHISVSSAAGKLIAAKEIAADAIDAIIDRIPQDLNGVVGIWYEGQQSIVLSGSKRSLIRLRFRALLDSSK